jgi:outer membrane lipoprotein
MLSYNKSLKQLKKSPLNPLFQRGESPRYNEVSKIIIIALVFLIVSGCAHVISKDIRDSADRELSLTEMFGDPDVYMGKTVILGGIIAGGTNTGEGTYLEVVQQPLDSLGRPVETDRSLGRFLVLHDGYLDTVLYARGKSVTVAGEILGGKIQPLGEISYSYPLIKSREIHIVKKGGRFPIHFGLGFGVAID